MQRSERPGRLVYVDKRYVMLGAIIAAATIGAGVLVGSGDESLEPVPTPMEQAALDWVLEESRSSQPSSGVSPSRYRGPFPDQGLPGPPRPHYVVYDREVPGAFYVVFMESEEMYTARYRLGRDDTTPKRIDFQLGYGWFDLSKPRDLSLQVWKLQDGDRWVWQPKERSISPIAGASFAVEYYDVMPPSDPRNRRHLYVGGSGSNTGDAAGRAECYLIYGSQSVLIDGPYLHVMVSPGETLSVSGDVLYPKRLDDYESGGVECRASGKGSAALLLRSFFL